MKNTKGITLIALIITIIVLLILIGVSISFVVGDNGILSQAGNAKTETDIAEEKEFAESAYSGASIENYGNGASIDKVQSEIDKLAGEGKAQVTQNEDGTFNVKYVDSGREYTVGKVDEGFVNWEAILQDANQYPNNYKYSDQIESEYVAIGTDGNAVNMDLWNPTLNEDGTWRLGQDYDKYMSDDNSYVGGITDDGTIVGCVPQYIYNESKDEFTPVTKMCSTFLGEFDLVISPEIPNTVTDMQGCFNYCTSLERAPKLPENLNNITSIFQGCTSLTDIIIPNSVTSIDYLAFKECKSLENIIIPDSVTSIGEQAFCGCASLKNIVIPDSVTSIGEAAFCGCASLKNIVIPDSVMSIGYRAFALCSTLENITIPSSVTSIANGTFENCKALTNIIIPDSITSIEQSAFLFCDNLESVYFNQTIAPTFGSSCFEKRTEPVTTFYFKNSTVADAFTTSYYNSSYGVKSTDYSWDK